MQSWIKGTQLRSITGHWGRARRSALSLTLVVAPLLSMAACGTRASEPPVSPDAFLKVQIHPRALSEPEFAKGVAQLMDDGEATGERLNLLVAVVQHQLARAGRYFASGQEQAAMDAVTGALLLVRSGELRREMFVGHERTLLHAAAAVSRRGNEGEARAFYDLIQPLISEPAVRADVSGHLRALRAWEAETLDEGSMVAAGARRVNMSARSMVDRGHSNLRAAQQSTQAWVERAFELGRAVEDGTEPQPMTHEAFDERSEAHRAVTIGAPIMAALFLRDGDAAGAVAALEVEPMSAITNPKFSARLSDAADGDGAAWADLFNFYQSSKGEADIGIEPGLALGAAWGAAVARYRAENASFPAAVALAILLTERSMGDAALALVDPALGKDPSVRNLSWALGLLMQSLEQAEARSDLTLARATYANGKRLVELASSENYAKKVQPSAADVWQAIGGFESRAGNLEAARPYLKLASQRAPNAQVLRLLAAIDRQKGDRDAALQSLTQMLALARAAGEPGAEAATLIMIYDLERERGKTAEASTALQSALGQVLLARSKARSSAQIAGTERVLADVLERYGERDGANRAVERAEDAARNDTAQLTATLLDAARRSLVLPDLQAGRRALRLALDGDLSEEDLTYAALWVKLLQQRMGVPSDGSVEEALARVDGERTWIGGLRDWARGNLSSEQLLARASTPTEKVEAAFYVALSDHLAKRDEGALAQLQAIASSEAIELVEVRIAREFLLIAQGAARPTLPTGIEIP